MLGTRLATPLIALLLLGQGVTTRALGQAPGDGDAAALEVATDAPPVYVVEFLIFAYTEFSGLEEEFVPSTPHWPRSLSSVALRATPETLQPGSAAWHLEDVLAPREPAPGLGGAAPPGAAIPPVAPPLGDQLGIVQPPPATTRPARWYRLLEGEELELGRARARLAALGAYTPLLHAGWSQATLLEDEAQAFELAWLGRLRPAGSIRLHRSRFLHLTLDISLQDDYRYRQSPAVPDSRWPLAEFTGPVRYRIDAQRRLRSGELHFFDHPAFGVLITVRPAPADPATATGATARPAA